MKSYVAQRLGIAILTLVGMSMVIFALLRLAPGDIVDILFSTAGYVNESDKQALLKELGMDRPYWVQYLDWMRQILTGDLGKSYRYDIPAWEIIRPLLPVTIELAILSIIVAVALGVPTGVISAVRQDTTLDYVLRVVSLAGLSMPSFWLGMVIILGMVSWLGWIPPMTYVRPTENFKAHAILAARGHARGLHPHGVGQGAGGAGRDLAPRAQERDPARGHRHRHRVRVPHRRPGGDRDRVQPARRRTLPRAGDPVARLPDRAEPRDVHRHRGDPVEPLRRHALRRARPARALWQLVRSACPSTSWW